MIAAMPKKPRRKPRFRRRSPLSLAIALAAIVLAYLGGSGELTSLRERAMELGRRAGEAVRGAPAPAPVSTAPGTADPAALSGDSPITVFFAPDPPDSRVGPDDALLGLINGARESIRCAFYDIEYMPVADALIAKHAARVKVEVVSDTNYADRAAVRRMIDAKVPVIFDEREAFMHNKFCVVDGAAVWTGSTNVTNNCMFRNDNNALVVRSREIAENYTAEFAEMFEKGWFGARSPARTPHPVVKLGEIEVQNWFAPEDGVEARIVEQIGHARKSVLFLAYAFTSDPIGDAMIAAMKRGVTVRGVFETRTMRDDASEAGRLRHAGAEVSGDGGQYNMHNKVIIIDAATVITGSYNFSRNANEDNDENVLCITSPAIAAQYVQRFEAIAK